MWILFPEGIMADVRSWCLHFFCQIILQYTEYMCHIVRRARCRTYWR